MEKSLLINLLISQATDGKKWRDLNEKEVDLKRNEIFIDVSVLNIFKATSRLIELTLIRKRKPSRKQLELTTKHDY